MGNSAHSRVSKDGGSEGSPRSLRQKSIACSVEASGTDEGKGSSTDVCSSENGPKNKGMLMEITVKPDPLTEEQMDMLQENWKELEDNIAKVGVITFIRKKNYTGWKEKICEASNFNFPSLFETHPDVQDVFLPFQGMELEELRHSKQLKAHALRVMAFVQKAVARLHEPDKLDVLLRELGKKHYSYGAKQQFIDYIGPQFIQAIKPSLGEKWTEELQNAWIALFNYMGVIMKAAMDLEERRAAAESLPPYTLPPSTALPPGHSSSFAPTKSLPHGSRRASSDVAGGGIPGTSLIGANRRGTLY